MRYLIEHNECKVSLEDPTFTNIEVNYYDNCDRWGVDFTLSDAHGSEVTITGLYMGDGEPPEDIEVVKVAVITNYLQPLVKP